MACHTSSGGASIVMTRMRLIAACYEVTRGSRPVARRARPRSVRPDALADRLADLGRAIRDVVRARAPRRRHRGAHRGRRRRVRGRRTGRPGAAGRMAASASAGRATWCSRASTTAYRRGARGRRRWHRGPWTFIVDPVDGTRPYLADLRSAWVLLGAGRHAVTPGGARGRRRRRDPDVAGPRSVGWSGRGSAVRPRTVDDDLTDRGREPVPVELRPQAGADPTRTFLTVVRLLPAITVRSATGPTACSTGGGLRRPRAVRRRPSMGWPRGIERGARPSAAAAPGHPGDAPVRPGRPSWPARRRRGRRGAAAGTTRRTARSRRRRWRGPPTPTRSSAAAVRERMLRAADAPNR